MYIEGDDISVYEIKDKPHYMAQYTFLIMTNCLLQTHDPKKCDNIVPNSIIRSVNGAEIVCTSSNPIYVVSGQQIVLC